VSAHVWRIGQLLNAVQSTFVGLLKVWSIPIVLMLSIASGYTTYYGMSYFISGWIALIITVAVQSIIVICTLELAGIHWKANLPRFLSTGASLLVALAVSVSFSYFKFYEFSQRDSILIERLGRFEQDILGYLDAVARLKSHLAAEQKKRADAAAHEETLAYLGAHPTMKNNYRGHVVGKGPFWQHYNEIQERERGEMDKLEREIGVLDERLLELRANLKEFTFRMNDPAAFEKVLLSYNQAQIQADNLAARHGATPVKSPKLMSFAEFGQSVTPTFAMWQDISWFPLACAAMVDFFTLILSYRLEFTAPGPLTEEEKELAYQGLKQFSDFTINRNDELEFSIEKTELERARRISDWSRMFAVSFLLNRGFLRKISNRKVEFAPNLYPIVAERMRARRDVLRSANDERLQELMEKKTRG
jgi:hypothetical protein